MLVLQSTGSQHKLEVRLPCTKTRQLHRDRENDGNCSSVTSYSSPHQGREHANHQFPEVHDELDDGYEKAKKLDSDS